MAVSRLRTALKLEDGMRARPLAARTRFWYARMLLDRRSPADRYVNRDYAVVVRRAVA